MATMKVSVPRPAAVPGRRMVPGINLFRGLAGRRGVPQVPLSAQTLAPKAFLYEKVDRRLPEVCARYPKLALSTDFTALINHWPTEKNLNIPLDVSIKFRTDPDKTVRAPEEPEAPENEPKVIARVMLLSTVKPEDVEGDKAPHMFKRVKFLVARKAKGGLMSIGGAWSKSKDGGNPNDDKTLIKTAIRHCKEICGVDLTPCKNWYKFIEVKYNRPSGAEDRTVVFLPDIWNHFAKLEHVDVCKQVGPQEVEVEEEVEETVEPEAKEGEAATGEKKTIKKKVMTKKTVEGITIRSMDLSLNGILEYDSQDKHEETVELSMFAEAFKELLSSRFAKDVLKILLAKKEKADVLANDLKRKRDEETAERLAKLQVDKEEREAKRQKLEEERKKEAEARAIKEAEEKLLTEEELKERRAKEAEEKKKKDEEEKKKREEELKKRKEAEEARKQQLEEERKKREEERKQKEEEQKAKKTKTKVVTTVHVDDAILAPFAFFDHGKPQPANFLRRDQVEGILYAMGGLCPREIDGLLRAVGMPKEKGQMSLYYKTLATTTTTVTEEVPIDQPEAEKASADKMQVDGETPK